MESVCITGMFRSGSTFVWQIINDINKFKILRTCYYIDNSNVTFVTYRDWRDVLVSWSKLHNSTIAEVYNPNSQRFFFKNGHWSIHQVDDQNFQMCLLNSLKYKRKFWNHPNYHFIKYENYFPNNTKALVEFIYASLQCELSEDKCNLLCEKFSLEKAQVVADKYDELQKKDRPKTSLPNQDPQTKIHGGHITNNGQIGAWKQYIDDVEVMNIFSSLQDSLEEFGYQI